MTNMQIAYWNLQELKRSNLARETETNRSNVTNEGENRRHNMQSEGIGWAQVGESRRHNQVMEAQGVSSLITAARRVNNDYIVGSRNAAAREGELSVKQQEADIKQGQLDENVRHNKKSESQATWGLIIDGANMLINNKNANTRRTEAMFKGAGKIGDLVIDAARLNKKE